MFQSKLRYMLVVALAFVGVNAYGKTLTETRIYKQSKSRTFRVARRQIG
ncbi:MAG: hypothetical protein H7326_05640 [Bdellovibrionaceae bacterium]|nr:hypothetical protein [Pseudobdellovibrionaceae bacterium]